MVERTSSLVTVVTTTSMEVQALIPYGEMAERTGSMVVVTPTIFMAVRMWTIFGAMVIFTLLSKQQRIIFGAMMATTFCTAETATMSCGEELAMTSFTENSELILFSVATGTTISGEGMTAWPINFGDKPDKTTFLSKRSMP